MGNIFISLHYYKQQLLFEIERYNKQGCTVHIRKDKTYEYF